MNPDLQMQHDVMAELQLEPAIDAAPLGIAAQDGVVTLSGSIGSYAERWRAERAVRRVPGVQAVMNVLEVVLPLASQRCDADIAHAAKFALQCTTNLPKDSISVSVQSAWLTLSGSVEWDYQRRAAVAAIRSLVGIRGLRDRILIQPKVSSGVVQAQIASMFTCRAATGAQRIVVEVTGASVVLSGSADSFAARDLACRTAWSTPGVHHVIDNIHVIG